MRRLAGAVFVLALLSGCGAGRPVVTDMTGHARPAASNTKLRDWSAHASIAHQLPLLQQAAPGPAPDQSLDRAYRRTLDGFERYVNECAAADDSAAGAAYNDYASGSDAVLQRVDQLS